MKSLFDRNYPMNKSSGIQSPIRVLLIDDSMLTLHGLKTFLSKCNHIDIVGVAKTRTEAFAAIRTYRPDVVVLEVRVGDASGIDLCKTIRESYPNIGVLFFTAHGDENLLRSAILAGAEGYLLKSAAAEAVARSIEIVATGKAIIDHRLTHLVIMWLRDGDEAAQEGTKDSCSKDDLRLLSLVASGKTNKEIASKLNVLPSIVALRLRKIYKRLNISRRSEAARCYARLERDSSGHADPIH